MHDYNFCRGQPIGFPVPEAVSVGNKSVPADGLKRYASLHLSVGVPSYASVAFWLFSACIADGLKDTLRCRYRCGTGAAATFGNCVEL